MAATEATRRNRTARNADRTHLPLTPKVTSARRGGHLIAARANRAESPVAESATPAMHITPNVVVATRGGVRSERRAREGRSILQASALDLHRFRA